MKEKTIQHAGISITVVPATAAMGMERSLLKAEAEKAEGESRSLQLLHKFVYPDLVSCVREAKGIELPLSFERFAGLPDELVTRWERAAYEVNPHWQPGYNEGDAEKKV